MFNFFRSFLFLLPLIILSSPAAIAQANPAESGEEAINSLPSQDANESKLGNAPLGLGDNSTYEKILADNAWTKRIQAKGKLKIGFDIFRPWAMQNKNGQYIGFEVQVAEALAADLGVKAEFVPTAWDGIIPALLTGRFDIIIGGIGISEERAKRVAFTDPYEFSGVGIAASKTAAPNLNSLNDFNKKNIIVVAKSGTTAAIAAKELLPNAVLKTFDHEDQTAQELRSGKAHALIAAAPYPAELALKNKNEIYMPLKGTLTREPCGMALSPKDSDALPALNAWIAARFASQWLDSVWAYWFESLEWEAQLKR